MRRRFPIILFACLLGFDLTNFLLQKTASNHATGNGLEYVKSLLTHPFVWLALATAPLHLWTWTRILARTDISVAFPLTSLSYPLTLIAAVWVFHENLNWQVWTGALLITAGAAILGPGHGLERD